MMEYQIKPGQKFLKKNLDNHFSAERIEDMKTIVKYIKSGIEYVFQKDLKKDEDLTFLYAKN